jgi:hypothetical protein
MLFKLINKLTPAYLVHHLWSQNTQNYDLRRMSQKIQIRELPHIAIFFPATIRETGIVFPKTFHKPDQSRVLKKLLQHTNGQKIHSVHSLGRGYEKTANTSLRLEHSSLNEYLFKYNLSLNKFSEQCYGNHIDTTEHFNRCTVSRTTLLFGVIC